MMTDNLAALAEHESFNALERVLQCARRIDRKTGPHQKKQDEQECEDQQLHRKRIRDGRGRIFGSMCSARRKDVRGFRAGDSGFR